MFDGFASASLRIKESKHFWNLMGRHSPPSHFTFNFALSEDAETDLFSDPDNPRPTIFTSSFIDEPKRRAEETIRSLRTERSRREPEQKGCWRWTFSSLNRRTVYDLKLT